jgi:NADH-quinone oxidoreductase subunit E
MLSNEERRDIAAEIVRYPTLRAASIDCLMRLQQHRGWLSDAALRDLAPELAMSVHELDAIATFYNRLFRRPVGRHVIRYCDSVSCWMLGAETLAETLQQRLGIAPGETTEDGRFTLLPTQCLGACHRAPVLSVDDEQHTDLDPNLNAETLARILDDYA